MTPFDRAKFQLSASEFKKNCGTMIFNGVMSNQSQKSLFNLTCE